MTCHTAASYAFGASEGVPLGTFAVAVSAVGLSKASPHEGGHQDGLAPSARVPYVPGNVMYHHACREVQALLAGS